jgi:hypothetical protein
MYAAGGELKRTSANGNMAGELGFEPRFSESETDGKTHCSLEIIGIFAVLGGCQADTGGLAGGLGFEPR